MRATASSIILFFVFSVCPVVTMRAADPRPGGVPGPLSPREEMATFRLLPGFRAELVACEPEVVDPVAMAFDERGRIFVAEMRGYPNGGRGTGTITSGRIKCLTDTDGDGYYETSALYAEGLRFPTGVMPYKGGLLVANAPDLLYFEDTDDDGRSDKRRVLYTGFGVENIQQLLNSLQWGLDNWVHGCAGSNGGTVTCPEKPDFPALTLRNRHVRFHPDIPGSLEPTSGGGQYGLSPDAFGRWFTATNSQHLRHVVLPDHYLRRNPYLSVPAVTLDIPDHGAACQVFRISPFEAWRVERTSRRLLDPRYANWPASEKVPGGFVTSGCSPVVYTADLFPEPYRGNTFVCDPANNLIHRDTLEPAGGTFVAKRVDDGCEFLASPDNWFRPVHLTVGPDGALYILDFYREAIETPLSLPDDIKAKMNLESRGRGRIWRIVPDRLAATRSGARFDLRKTASADLVAKLREPNSWWRYIAQRLLIERQDQSIVPTLEALARTAREPEGRVHALRTLEGLRALASPLVETALADASPDVREHALQLSEPFLSRSDALRSAVLAKTDDPNERVRFQTAFTLGGLDPAVAAPGLARILRREGADPWTQSAALSSAARCAPDLMARLAADAEFLSQGHATAVLRRIATVVGAQADPAALARAFKLVAEQSPAGINPAARQAAVLDGLGQGLQNSKLSLRTLWEKPPPQLADVVHAVRPTFEHAAGTAADDRAPLVERVAAVRLLGFGPFAIAGEPLAALLSPRQPPEIQSAAVRALAAQDQPRTVELLLAGWDSYGPSLRREVVEALLARPARVVKLLDAVEAKRVSPAQLEAARRDQLRNHRNAEIRQRAVALFANVGASDRRKVVEDYRGVLEMPGDVARGKPLFLKHCAVCHKLDGAGHEVGPDLRAVLGNKTREALLTDVLDPNREVDPRYVNYQVTTTSGRVLTGMLAAETPASVTLRRAENAEDTILRSQIESLQATGQSLMPDELEKQVSKQDLADVIEFLLPTGAKPASRERQRPEDQKDKLPVAHAPGSPRRPNIVFILADDLGYGDLGCYGQKLIQTPNLDRMASEGMRFTQCYAGSTVCAPSRCALMTGLHTGHCRIRGNANVPLEPGDRTVAELLKSAGYATGLVGKWGLGEARSTGVPNKKGFDEFFGFLNQTHAHNYYPDFLWRNEQKEPLAGNVLSDKPQVSKERAEYAQDLFTSEALSFIDRHKTGPFFLYLAYTTPHANNERTRAEGNGNEVPDVGSYADRNWPGPEKNKAAMITRLDTDVGRVFAKLKELGVDENTIVFFTSDNGPHREGGNDPKFFQSSGPLRGIKRDLYDGGIRVPMIVRWAGHVKAGSTNDFVWAFWDFPPTAAELAGASAPAGIDGRSVVPALTGQGTLKPHDYLYWEFHEQGSKQAVRTDDWKAVRLRPGGAIELYDVKSDPGEAKNVASEHPDVVARVEAYLKTARTENARWPLSDTPAKGKAKAKAKGK